MFFLHNAHFLILCLKCILLSLLMRIEDRSKCLLMLFILSTKYIYFKYILVFVSIRVAPIRWILSLTNIFDVLYDIKVICLFTLCVDKWPTRAARFLINGESWFFIFKYIYIYIYFFFFFYCPTMILEKNTTKQNNIQFARGSDIMQIASICL